MMFSMMRRMVTLQAEPVRNWIITKKNAPRPISEVYAKATSVGLEQPRRIGKVSCNASNDAQQGRKHQDVAARGPAADFKLVFVGDGTMRSVM